MRFKSLLLASIWVAVLSGCGGGGGGGHTESTVSNAQFRVMWPARTRELLPVSLTSAQSATVTLTGAGNANGNVTVNINRDPAHPEGYIGTYTIPQAITPSRLGSMTATFYALANQGGDVVGTATSTSMLSGTSVEFAPITLNGRIIEVVAAPATVRVGDPATQLLFTARDEEGNTVAVTPGSASWNVTEGDDFINVTADGMATGVALGTAQVTVTVDEVSSLPSPVQVTMPSAPVYAWTVAKEGQLIEPSFDAVEGNLFEVNGTKNIVVTKLGYEAARGDQSGGITAIFDANGTMLASATITSADPLQNGYHYKEIPPLELNAGSQYYIGSLHTTGAAGAYLWTTQSASTPDFIVDLGTAAKITSTIEGGSWSTPGSPRHYVGNFQAHQIE